LSLIPFLGVAQPVFLIRREFVKTFSFVSVVTAPRHLQFLRSFQLNWKRRHNLPFFFYQTILVYRKNYRVCQTRI